MERGTVEALPKIGENHPFVKWILGDFSSFLEFVLPPLYIV
jgi:hypothetical protein